MTIEQSSLDIELYHSILEDDINIIKNLINKGGDVNYNTYYNTKFSPLMLATKYKMYDICKLLLKSGADVNMGNTALMLCMGNMQILNW